MGIKNKLLKRGAKDATRPARSAQEHGIWGHIMSCILYKQKFSKSENFEEKMKFINEFLKIEDIPCSCVLLAMRVASLAPLFKSLV